MLLRGRIVMLLWLGCAAIARLSRGRVVARRTLAGIALALAITAALALISIAWTWSVSAIAWYAGLWLTERVPTASIRAGSRAREILPGGAGVTGRSKALPATAPGW